MRSLDYSREGEQALRLTLGRRGHLCQGERRKKESAKVVQMQGNGSRQGAEDKEGGWQAVPGHRQRDKLVALDKQPGYLSMQGRRDHHTLNAKPMTAAMRLSYLHVSAHRLALAVAVPFPQGGVLPN